MKLGDFEDRKKRYALEDGILENFIKANERYGNWPLSVWEIKDASVEDRALKSKAKGVGDAGSAREGSFPASGLYKGAEGRGQDGAVVSIFPPRVATNILTMFAPKEGLVYDPFAGGGTRAVLAAKAGLDYLGVEIREEEVEHLKGLIARHKVGDRVDIVHGDSRKRNSIESECADFLYTCPPYWNLEQYEGGPGDISMMDYEGFLKALAGIISNCHRILKPGSLACWVVGLHRTEDKNHLLPLHHHIALLHTNLGFTFKEEIIIHRNNPMALQRVGNFERGNKLLIRVHEYCLIFRRE